jgi:protein-arginine kinase activator protein McsA
MKRDDVPSIYKVLVQMKDFADKLENALKNQDFDKASQIKLKLLDLQRSLKKII